MTPPDRFARSGSKAMCSESMVACTHDRTRYQGLGATTGQRTGYSFEFVEYRCPHQRSWAAIGRRFLLVLKLLSTSSLVRLHGARGLPWDQRSAMSKRLPRARRLYRKSILDGATPRRPSMAAVSNQPLVSPRPDKACLIVSRGRHGVKQLGTHNLRSFCHCSG